MKSFFRCVACLCCLGLFLAGCGSDKAPESQPQVYEVTLAIGRDCPQTVKSILESFGNDILSLSGGTVHIVLQNWDSPLQSGADLCYVSAASLAQNVPALQVLRRDFVFSSYEHMNTALNAASILEEIGDLLSSSFPYDPYCAFYTGKQYLISGESRFLDALRSENAEDIAAAVDDVTDGMTAIEPADFSSPPTEDVLYYADTETLSALNADETEGYTLILLDYRFNFGLLCLNKNLTETLSQTQLAYLYEAAATALPACDQFYQRQDRQIPSLFHQTVLPSQKLRREVRQRQEQSDEAITLSRLYLDINEYAP